MLAEQKYEDLWGVAETVADSNPTRNQVDKEPLHVYVDILPLNLIIFTIKSVAIYMNSRLSITQTFKGNQKHFELS